MTLTEINDEFPEESFLIADGFDDCIVGIEPKSMRIVYNIDKMIESLMKQDLSYHDAIEYLEFNTFCAYVGDKTPIYIKMS